MVAQYHILNGDALKAQFPNSLSGALIILRECLVDGAVDGDTLAELLATRAAFISQHYEGVTEAEYYEQILPEFQKIKNIPPSSEVNLWFEEDLFCQVNFWFTIHLLQQYIPNASIYLVKPNTPNQYSFGYLSHEELVGIYEQRQLLVKKETLASLWPHYQNQETDQLLQVAENLAIDYPFLLPVIKAHLARIPTNGHIGYPSQVLLQIKEEIGTNNFAAVFKVFNKRAAIYGFGDLQVRRLWDNLVSDTDRRGL